VNAVRSWVHLALLCESATTKSLDRWSDGLTCTDAEAGAGAIATPARAGL
jgi:hypothetical protein